MASTTDWEKKIKDQYNNQLNAQKTRLEETYNQNKLDYDKQLDDAPEQYQSLRNQAYTDNAMAEQSRKENMANMGLSGAGGTSQTLQQRNQTSLLGTLGDVSRQQQDYTDNINLALGKLNTQYDADVEAATQQNQADLEGALISYGQWQAGQDLSEEQLGLSKEEFGLNKDQFGLSKDQFGLSQQQFEQDQKNTTFEQYMTLYKNRRITKKQLKSKLKELGIDI